MSSPSTCTKAWLLLAMLTAAFPASAAKIETLLMPGKVIEGHAEFESECTHCHDRFSKDTQNRLCLDCHDHSEVDKDITRGKGYHGLSPEVNDTACSTCHTDHKGRNANVVPLDRELFNHKFTDFQLEGAHSRAQCSSCHEKGTLWRDAPGQCIDCHKEDDVHKGDFGKKCADCHGVDNWRERDFDHDTTDFPLEGAHNEVLCAACHPNRRYEDIPMKCVSCHRGDDVHRGGYGKKCKSCHNSEKWDKTEFDHNTTDFELRGAHDKTACNACHLPGKDATRLSSECIDCHRADDVHKGRNGERCQECHGSDNWSRASFDHDMDTDFSLKGPHKEATCNACHAGGVEKDAEVRPCFACHRGDDIHQGDLGEQCDSCHKVEGWGENVSFDHDLTQMPLYGMHALTSCESCHTQGRYATVDERQCNDCHSGDDVHKETLGSACGDCHNANGWLLWRFDHDQTDFELTGEHEGLACKGCHRKPPADETPTACISCHEDDDAHHGRFGRNCSRCHGTEKFNNVRMGP